MISDERLRRVEKSDSGSVNENTTQEFQAVSIWRAWKSRLPTGCYAGVRLSCLIAFIVFFLNSIIMIWALCTYKLSNGSGVLYRGGCNDAKRLSAVVQFGINILSTLLLGASNYCMQCLGAPTREEVDAAHAKNQSLCIGVPSFKNLRKISRPRAAAWILLGLTAFPIHFLYNSVIILKTQANSYQVMPGPSNFFADGFNPADFYQFENTWVINQADKLKDKLSSKKIQNLTVNQCLDAYVQQYVSDWGDVILVQLSPMIGTQAPTAFPIPSVTNNVSLGMSGIDLVNHTFATGSAVWAGANETEASRYPLTSDPNDFPSASWACENINYDYCNLTTLGRVLSGHDSWKPFDEEVNYCLSEKVDSECSLDLNVGIGIAVIMCNLAKACCMCLTLLWTTRAGFVTIGDAIESFLERPDPHTAGLCTFSAARLKTLWSIERIEEAWSVLPVDRWGSKIANAKEKPWQPESKRWWRSVSPMRHHPYLLLCIGLAMAGMGLLLIHEKDGQLPMGIGSVAGKNVIPYFVDSLMSIVLLSNSPQLLCSYIFLGFNYALTCMFTGREWIDYSQRRKPLRVSNPRGQQVSTYYLQLPYYFSMPLLAISGILSWLTSQILFAVRIQIRDINGYKDPNNFILTCGYSPGAIIITIIAGAVLAISVALIGLIKYPDSMPLAGVNSAAIAAGCHAVGGEKDLTLKPVMWGVVSDDGEIGHCTFSAGPVESLIPGRHYR